MCDLLSSQLDSISLPLTKIFIFIFCFPDRHHFDNPVYSFNSNARDDGSTQPLNNIQKIQVKNNLTKNNNLDRQKVDDEESVLKNGKEFL